MLPSRVIEVSGVLAGAAVTLAGRFRFVAVDPRVDPRVEELHGSDGPGWPDMRRVVSQLLLTGRLPAGNA